jgi:hypothetical protein
MDLEPHFADPRCDLLHRLSEIGVCVEPSRKREKRLDKRVMGGMETQNDRTGLVGLHQGMLLFYIKDCPHRLKCINRWIICVRPPHRSRPPSPILCPPSPVMAMTTCRCRGCNQDFTPRGLSQHISRTRGSCRLVHVTLQTPMPFLSFTNRDRPLIFDGNPVPRHSRDVAGDENGDLAHRFPHVHGSEVPSTPDNLTADNGKSIIAMC